MILSFAGKLAYPDSFSILNTSLYPSSFCLAHKGTPYDIDELSAMFWGKLDGGAFLRSLRSAFQSGPQLYPQTPPFSEKRNNPPNHPDSARLPGLHLIQPSDHNALQII